MNNNIKYLFIAGLCVLTLGWAFFVQKTSSEVQISRDAAFELKANLIQSRWNQVINRDVEYGLGKGPQVFNIELSSFDKAIKGSEFSQKYQGVSPSKIKAAFIDAGVEASFFTTQVNGETFFVKVKEGSEAIMLQGFSYTYILNLLNAGLKDSEWYFVDSKNRVVFSHQPSYLGKSKSFSAAFSKRLNAAGRKYSIQMVDPEPYKSASVLWIGVIGFLLLGLATLPNFSNSGTVGISAYADEELSSDVIVKKEEAGVSEGVDNAVASIQEKSVEERGLVERRYKAVEEDITEVSFKKEESVAGQEASQVNQSTDAIKDEVEKELEGVDEFKALELTNSNSSIQMSDEEGYSEFLTENPSLTMKMPAIPNKKIIDSEETVDTEAQSFINEKEEVVVEQAIPVQELADVALMSEDAAIASSGVADENRSGSDWIKLAEELSENLEKFAGEWQEKSPGTESEV